MLDPDTIVAVSTPPGRGGIGIVRLSGPRAVEIASPLLRLNHPLTPNRARFGHLLDLSDPANLVDKSVIPTAVEGPPHLSLHPSNLEPRTSNLPHPPSNLEPRTSNLVLDEIVATFFAAPHSYTAEDLVEIAAHGSPVLLEHIVRQCCARGARLAEPGEFTQRAFLAGRIDLTQAEAVADLIASSTLEQARLAARQLSGSLAHSIVPIKAALVALIATLEAGIDFAEDDIDVLPAAEISARIAAIHAPLQALERTFAYGRVVRDGFRLAIVGRPNAGKSSLFNQLVQRDRAIVTASPGTTRDLVTERVAIDGIPVDLIDTAGLRDSSDEAERLGVAKSHQAMADADVVLLVLDAPTLAANPALAPEDLAILARHASEDQAVLAAGAPATLLLALNKIDLLPNPSQISALLAKMLPNKLQDSLSDPELLGKPSLQAWPSQPGLEEKGALAPGANPSNLEPRTSNLENKSVIPTEGGTASSQDGVISTAAAGAAERPPHLPSPTSNLEPRTANLENKSVIPTEVEGPPHLSLYPSNLEPRTSNLIPTSALTGLGIPALRAAIVAAVAGPGAAPREAAMLTNLRQHQAVQESLRALAAALAAVAARIPHEMLLVDLYGALRALDSLTGATTTDDLLHLIFSTFCIGK
jgi:tRNA modification GTPase